MTPQSVQTERLWAEAEIRRTMLRYARGVDRLDLEDVVEQRATLTGDIATEEVTSLVVLLDDEAFVVDDDDTHVELVAERCKRFQSRDTRARHL